MPDRPRSSWTTRTCGADGLHHVADRRPYLWPGWAPSGPDPSSSHPLSPRWAGTPRSLSPRWVGGEPQPAVRRPRSVLAAVTGPTDSHWTRLSPKGMWVQQRHKLNASDIGCVRGTLRLRSPIRTSRSRAEGRYCSLATQSGSDSPGGHARGAASSLRDCSAAPRRVRGELRAPPLRQPLHPLKDPALLAAIPL